MSTKVYFFGDESGRVKIGQTGDVQDRLQKCQTGNAETLTVLGWYCVTAWELFESSVHERFAKFRIRGEWFKRTPEIDAFIAKHCTSGPCSASLYPPWPATSATLPRRTPGRCPSECSPGFPGTASRLPVLRSLRTCPTF
jgi:Meiotically up-regulated gene 113